METDITIFCVTYNHAEFIKDALEGFLAQKTNYTYKVFVYDDASTDGTSEILRGYGQKYPDVFNIYIAKKNIYKDPNKDFLFQKLYQEHVTGRYVAMCEGDDCWIDSNKLQLQIDYLENHPECSMVAHGAQWIDYSLNQIKEYSPYESDRYLSAEEIILQRKGNLPTASLVMRREVFFKKSDFPKCDIGDVPQQLYALRVGKIFYFNRIMSIYRYLHSGSWSKDLYNNIVEVWEHKLRMADFYRNYDSYTSYSYHDFIKVKERECLSFPFMSGQLVDGNLNKIKEKVNEDTEFEYKDWTESQAEIIRLIQEPDYVSPLIRKYVKGKNHIIIMGIGKFSQILTLKLKNDNIRIDGYVISDDQIFLKKNRDILVWKLSEYPYEWQDTALIIAVGYQFQKEIERNLKEKQIEDFIAPYWI